MNNFAVIKTGGKQYKVSPGEKLKIEKLPAKEGEDFIFDNVLLTVKNTQIEIGAPKVEDAKVSAKILKQDRAKKVIIFKYKPKKRYKVKRGHRQPYTEILIESL